MSTTAKIILALVIIILIVGGIVWYIKSKPKTDPAIKSTTTPVEDRTSELVVTRGAR